jgi:hypothetical protein
LVVDEPAAKAWLAQSDLPERFKERVQQIPEGIREQAAAKAERRNRAGDGPSQVGDSAIDLSSPARVD